MANLYSGNVLIYNYTDTVRMRLNSLGERPTPSTRIFLHLPHRSRRSPCSHPQTLVKSFEVTEQPVRAAKFVARKQWVITGSDDMLIRVYNYNTMDKVKVFEAHTDYIRWGAREHAHLEAYARA